MDPKRILDQIPLLKRIGRVADQMGIEAYLVGGVVRDHWLQRASHDVDIVCVGNGVELAQRVAEGLEGAGPVSEFRRFGTAAFRHARWALEFVGARKESYTQGSRHPQISPSTLFQDQARRDFTINTLAVGLNADRWGQLVDPFNGLEDLRKRTLRTPLDPNATFVDDPLRILRAVRFAAQLNLRIDPATWTGLKLHAEAIRTISQERITGEINKLMAAPIPSKGWVLLDQLGLLALILPELDALKGTETIQGRSHKDNFWHTLAVLDGIAKRSDKLWLRWAALLHDIAKPRTKRFDPAVGFTFHGHEELGARMVPRIFRRLKLSLHAPMVYVQKLVRLHMRPIALVQEQVTDAAVRRLLYESGDDVEDLMALCRADITSKNEAKVGQYLNNFDQVERKMKAVEAKDSLRNFQPVLTGRDIMSLFGLPPGERIGELKNALKEAVLEGTVKNTREAALDYVITLGKARGLRAAAAL